MRQHLLNIRLFRKHEIPWLAIQSLCALMSQGQWSLCFPDMSLAPLAPIILLLSLPQNIPRTVKYLSVGLYFCFHQLLGESSLTTIGLGNDLWVYKNTTRNHFIDPNFLCFQSCLVLFWVFQLSRFWVLALQALSVVHSLSLHGSQAGPVIGWTLP